MEQSYEFSVEGIPEMSDADIHNVIAVILGACPENIMTKDQQTKLRKIICFGLRNRGDITDDFDYEKSWDIINAFIKRYMKFLGNYKGNADVKDILNVCYEAYATRFDEVFCSDSENRRLIIEWFQKNSQIPNDEAPTEIKNTKYGRGVFASRDIKKGDLISYYPMDWVADSTLCPMNVRDGHHPHAENLKWICIQNAGIVGYGNPYDKKGNPQRIINELREAEGRMTPRINDYGFSFGEDDEVVHIWGDPLCDQPNSWFRGCLINDGAYDFKKTKEDYDKEFQNMIHGLRISKCNTRLATRMVASRDIKKGEEILTAYGEGYWYSKGETASGDERGEESAKHNCRHHCLNLKTKGQKKKAKEKKKAQQDAQNDTFAVMREHLAKSCHEDQENYEGFDGNKWRVCVLGVNTLEDQRVHVDACFINGQDKWQEGHPTQFSQFYNLMKKRPTYSYDDGEALPMVAPPNWRIKSREG